jgi:UTP:GlnB (protein PII) uridylyltransferase
MLMTAVAIRSDAGSHNVKPAAAAHAVHAPTAHLLAILVVTHLIITVIVTAA